MNRAAKKVLEASIRHWKQNLFLAENGSLEFQDITSNNCALCKVFTASDCNGCPVSSDTGKSKCKGTPWHEVDDALAAVEGLDDANYLAQLMEKTTGRRKKRLIAAVKAEIAYLEGLK